MPARSLSPLQARVVLALESAGRQETTLEEIQRIAGTSRQFARKVAFDLVRKRWLQRLRRGHYLLNPAQLGPEPEVDTDPFRTGSRLVSPYYFGYATAAELRGLLPQAGRQYYLVTPRRDRPVVHHAAEFRFIHVHPRRFFGTQPWTRRSERLVVSDLERTVLDCVHRPEYSGGIAGAAQVLASAKRQLRWERLGRYLRRYGDRSLAWRIGYLAERVRPSVRLPSGWLGDLVPGRNSRYAPLGSVRVHGSRGRLDPRWHVRVNVPEAELFGELEVR